MPASSELSPEEPVEASPVKGHKVATRKRKILSPPKSGTVSKTAVRKAVATSVSKRKKKTANQSLMVASSPEEKQPASAPFKVITPKVSKLSSMFNKWKLLAGLGLVVPGVVLMVLYIGDHQNMIAGGLSVLLIAPGALFLFLSFNKDERGFSLSGSSTGSSFLVTGLLINS